MEDLDKLYDVIKEMTNQGNIFQAEENKSIENPELIVRESLIKTNGYTIKFDETFKEKTKEVVKVDAVLVENNIENGHGRTIDFNDSNWYNETKINGNVIMVSIDYNSNLFNIYTGHTFGRGITIDSELSSIDENNTKHYSKEIVRELRGLNNFIGSSEEYKKKEEEIKQKAEIVPNEKIIEAFKNLDIEAFKTGDFEHNLNNDSLEKTSEENDNDYLLEEKEEEKDNDTIEKLRELNEELSPERLRKLTEELKKEKAKEMLETPKYSESTMTRFGFYVKFLLDHGARKDLIELPAIQNIILNLIENGDPRVIAEGKSPISYRKPNEDGTFNIYGKTEGYSSSVVYEMDLDEQEENGYYVCLTKKDIRDYTLFDESKREPDEKIYIDKAGKIIENLSEKTK